MVIKCPCKDCKQPVRHVGCHSTCIEYIEWRKKMDNMNEEINKQKDNDNLVRTFKSDNLERIRRSHR